MYPVSVYFGMFLQFLTTIPYIYKINFSLVYIFQTRMQEQCFFVDTSNNVVLGALLSSTDIMKIGLFSVDLCTA